MHGTVPLEPSAQDEEEPRISPWACAEHAGQGRRAQQTLALRDLRNGQISGYSIEPSQAQPASKGGCIHTVNVPKDGTRRKPDRVQAWSFWRHA